jgi:hypothetical protein
VAVYNGTREKSASKGLPKGKISLEMEKASINPEKIAQKTCKIMRIIVLLLYIFILKIAIVTEGNLWMR